MTSHGSGWLGGGRRVSHGIGLGLVGERDQRCAGQPVKDVAKSLGMSIGTVYQYKSRVVARIRREIELFDGATKTNM